MKFRLQCHSMQTVLTGHNNDQKFIYSFVHEIVFGLSSESLTGDISVHSLTPNLFRVGQYYSVQIAEGEGK